MEQSQQEEEQQQEQLHKNDDDSSNNIIYYFGYGPMVHPTVRHRRGVCVEDEQVAILPDHRLTFAYGGVASVIKQRGYDVHGIVMRCRTMNDWKTLIESEGGYYSTELDVYPYNNGAAEHRKNEFCEFNPEDDDDDDSSSSSEESTPKPIRAHVFVMQEFDEGKLERPLERLPQERYLRLIATGMQKYGCDDDYIQYQIMGVPFKPSKKPNNYVQFPILPELSLWNATPSLPKISFQQYKQRLCTNSSIHLYFIVGKHVILIRNHDLKHHPGAIWFQNNGFGRDDVTFYLHMTHVDPDITLCETKQDVTTATQAWAENLLCESIAQGLTAHRVFTIVENKEDEEMEKVEQILTLLQRISPSQQEEKNELRSSSSSSTSTATNTTITSHSSKSESSSSCRSCRPRRRPTLLRRVMGGLRRGKSSG